MNPPRPGDGPEARQEGPLTPEEWRRAVWALDGGRCVLCGVRVPRDADLWTWQCDHVIPKGLLRARGLRQYVWDARNGVVLCKRDHERHTTATVRVPYERVPRAVAFAAELGTWAEDLLLRLHPPSGRTT